MIYSGWFYLLVTCVACPHLNSIGWATQAANRALAVLAILPCCAVIMITINSVFLYRLYSEKIEIWLETDAACRANIHNYLFRISCALLLPTKIAAQQGGNYVSALYNNASSVPSIQQFIWRLWREVILPGTAAA